jgi:hypothetical protein
VVDEVLGCCGAGLVWYWAGVVLGWCGGIVAEEVLG